MESMTTAVTRPCLTRHACERLAERFGVTAQVGAPVDLEASVRTVSGTLSAMRGWTIRGIAGSLAVLSDDDASVVTVMVERPSIHGSLEGCRGARFCAHRSELPRDLIRALAAIRATEDAAVALGHRRWTLEGDDLVARFGWARGDHSRADFGSGEWCPQGVLCGGPMLYAHAALARADDYLRGLMRSTRMADHEPSLDRIEEALRERGALRSDLAAALSAAREARRGFGMDVRRAGVGGAS